jgi:hypothetical protein
MITFLLVVGFLRSQEPAASIRNLNAVRFLERSREYSFAFDGCNVDDDTLRYTVYDYTNYLFLGHKEFIDFLADTSVSRETATKFDEWTHKTKGRVLSKPRFSELVSFGIAYHANEPNPYSVYFESIGVDSLYVEITGPVVGAPYGERYIRGAGDWRPTLMCLLLMTGDDAFKILAVHSFWVGKLR